VTVDSLNGEGIDAFSLKMANEMNLGRMNFQDGILFCLSKKEGLIRIEIGKGLERVIPNDKASLINHEYIIPKCKAGNYFEGFMAGIIQFKKLIEENKGSIGLFDKN
jgi:uncharacterized protein